MERVGVATAAERGWVAAREQGWGGLLGGWEGLGAPAPQELVLEWAGLCVL